ncbi:Astacin-like metalloprotease toxin 1 [Araneus ventricosus]|uniref:Metalloendopeptidase n=1 Tax=Araneus ventricosus TaxID=182803 RepID=A0A4Y2N1A0_ARAVE|nr:Astacin-like metalloprotease toxin 1 [Araneus ventricosus]
MRALIVFLLVAVATATPDSQRWPNGVVPYFLDASVSHIKDLIQKSMRHIEQNSCIRFKKRTNEHNYIRIFYGNGCWSFWGLLNQGEQKVSLGDRCDYFGTVVHELLHALGFEHEHNRSDRDNYLDIHLENVEKEWHHAFKKLLPNENRLLTSFDFDSVMLYGEGSFAKAHGLKSMTAKDGRFMDEPYNKPGMSASDIKRLNMLYQC